MSDKVTRGWSENDKNWRRNCSSQVAAKSSFEGVRGVLQLGVVSRSAFWNFVGLASACPLAIIGCHVGLGAKIGRIAT
jgi:hypothetical protein